MDGGVEANKNKEDDTRGANVEYAETEAYVKKHTLKANSNERLLTFVSFERVFKIR